MKMAKIFLFSLMLVVMPLLTLPAPASAQAITNTVKVKFPYSGNLYAPCANGGAGEVVSVSGDVQGLISITINDNSIRMSQHWQGVGISGTGNTTGDLYQAVGVNRYDTIASFNGQFKQSIADNFRLIGQGSGNNLLMHHTLHVTINSNGDVTVTVDNFWVECK
ncbi:MAG: hypothetical protein AB1631_05520 [Acidobacteriota bacterium]